MRNRLAFLLAALCALTMSACSTVHGIKPLGRGVVEVEGSVGGPITKVYGAPIPLPISTIGTTVGVTDTTNVHGAWHPTAAAVFGLGAGDIGASQQLLAAAGARPRLMADLTLLLAGGDTAKGSPEGGVRFFAQPSVIAGWDWGKAKHQTVYTGITAFIEPTPGPHALGAWVLGNRFEDKRTQFTMEFKWIDPWESNLPIVPEYYSPGNLGAISLQFGVGYRFGGAK